MYVCKFGGSSISSFDNIIKVKNIIIKKLEQKNKLILVFSAIGNTTDILDEAGVMASLENKNYTKKIDDLYNIHISIIKNLKINSSEIIIQLDRYFNDINKLLLGINYLKYCSKRINDLLLSYGEKISNLIIYSYLSQSLNNINIKTIDSTDYIITDNNFGSAMVLNHETKKRFNKLLNIDFDLLVVSGFISKTKDNIITTLGRGGGDYSAAIFGSYFNVDIVEIWTDVDGIMTSDPRIVDNAKSIDYISYNEMMELSHYGANVIYTPTILPLYKKKIPIIVKNTFNPDFKGTTININNISTIKLNRIATAISNIKKVTLIKIYGNYLIGKIGFSGKLFSELSNSNINIIMISQSSSEHSIYIVINNKDFEVAEQILNRKYSLQIQTNEVILEFYNDKSVLSIETNNNENIVDISAKIYPIFKKYNIKINTQITSDHNICLILDRKNLESIQKLIHDELFFEKKYVNIIITGIGLVGSELIKQIKKHKYINVIGIANSKKLLYNDKGIDLDNYQNDLDMLGNYYNMNDLTKLFIDSKLSNKVFVDCTSSESIYNYYEQLLQNFISVVTPNKKANTSNYDFFNKITSFPNYKYETTVGAGLPVVDTIKNLINNGDKIIKVEAILSGTMSYIFNTFSETEESFINVVKKAQKLGFTEPNPRDDLNGMDVVRKILIISRLSGLNLEISDVENKIFLSEECLNCQSTEEFYNKLEDFQENINNMKNEAKNRNKVIKHIATLENNKASVGLKEIDSSHPFYYLNGSDNMLIITSNYYNTNKLIIRGPGAGASVTAAGILSDIIISVN